MLYILSPEDTTGIPRQENIAGIIENSNKTRLLGQIKATFWIISAVLIPLLFPVIIHIISE